MIKPTLSTIAQQECDDDYVQSWYPVARCYDLKKGQQQAVTLFGADWILFRTQLGDVSFLKRHCCHMGADLCQGKIVDETIECPLHAWCFDVSGECVHIPNFVPADDKALPDRSIVHLKCEEKYGMIFVFWGDKALFSIPSPPEISHQQIVSGVLAYTFDSNYKVFSLNSFDTQHFMHVHNRKFIEKPTIYKVGKYALRIDLKAEIHQRKRWVDYILALKKKVFSLSFECWGGNLLAVKNHDFKSYAVIGLQPINKHQTKIYLVSMKEVESKPQLLDKLAVFISVRLFRNFLVADLKAVKNIRLHQAGLVDDLDEGAKNYWDFFASLPKIKGSIKGEKNGNRDKKKR